MTIPAADPNVRNGRQANGAPESSRESLSGAGWTCSAGSFTGMLDKRNRPFSWLSLAPLWESRNDKIARWLGDPVNDRRRAWMAALGEERSGVVDYSDHESISFMVMGDTGEGDASQYAVVPPLLSQAAGTAFLFICSDVIYPAGGAGDYRDKFFRPYDGYRGPIYAVPGNHDWYDDLTGFMLHFCGVEKRPPVKSKSFKGWVRDFLSSKPEKVDPAAVAEMRALRGAPEQQGRQPGPYFAIDAGPVLLVGIDTGISAGVDRDQGDWLRRVSRDSPKPKILLTGKPLYVDGQHRPGHIEGGGTVDEIVRAPEHNYVAAIGGDIHNYQRYPVALPDGRLIQYVVSGGGGAFMHATHKIPKVDLPGVIEDEFRCYPLRGDSLSLYSKLYDRKLGFGRGRLVIPPDQAAAIMSERLGIAPVRPDGDGVTVTDQARRAAAIVFPLPGRGRGALHLPFSEFFDWNDPPLFKSFLRVDAGPRELRIRCFAATGCLAQEQQPPVEDEIRAEVGADGRWRWVEGPAPASAERAAVSA
jgi:Calcineurin-like phosphoesterase